MRGTPRRERGGPLPGRPAVVGTFHVRVGPSRVGPGRVRARRPRGTDANPQAAPNVIPSVTDDRPRRPAPTDGASGPVRAGSAPTRRVPRADGSGFDWVYDNPGRAQTSVLPRQQDARHQDARRREPGNPPPRPGGARPPAGGARNGRAPAARPPAAHPLPRRRRRHRGRAVLAALLVLLVLVGGGILGLGAWGWSKVGRTAAFPTGNRPAATAGTNYLLVGSDSRAGLTAAQKRALGTGSAVGQRTDTILLLHAPTGGGKPVIVSIPRDSYLPIPGYGSNKVNAAFAIGGPPLLVRTVEAATGVHIDRYVEIGFGGFAGVVDDVGGVRLCLPRAINDPKAHIDLPAGCQTLDGANALGYVRARYSDPRGDLGRVARQRQFVSALLAKVNSPATLLNPRRIRDLAGSGGAALTVDDGMSSWQALSLARAARAATSGGGTSITVPVGAGRVTSAGDSVIWNADLAGQLFAAIRADKPIPSAVVKAGS